MSGREERRCERLKREMLAVRLMLSTFILDTPYKRQSTQTDCTVLFLVFNTVQLVCVDCCLQGWVQNKCGSDLY